MKLYFKEFNQLLKGLAYYHFIKSWINNNFHVIPLYPDAPWYLVDLNGNSGTYLDEITDGLFQTCASLDMTSRPQLLKTTVNESYTYLDVKIAIDKPEFNFGQAHPDCDQVHSMLLTHDSSEAIANGLTCSPFCKVPKQCQLREVEPKRTGNMIYWFFCKCAVSTCNELFLILHSSLARKIINICWITIVHN